MAAPDMAEGEEPTRAVGSSVSAIDAAGTPSSRLQFVRLGDVTGPNTPKAPPQLIHGLLGAGEVMLIAGASKSGKTWLTTYLMYCLATGGEWLGFECEPCTVLYANLEIGAGSFARRCETVRERLGVEWDLGIPVELVNARGLQLNARQFVDGVVEHYASRKVGAVFVDTLYMLEEGDENSVADMKPLLATLGELCHRLSCSLVVTHHQPKGSAGGKATIDRMAGSGVFARWPDVLVDLSQVDVDEGSELGKQMAEQGNRALRMTFTTRNVVAPQPVDLIFTGQGFVCDTTGELAQHALVGSARANGARGGRGTAKVSDERRSRQIELVDSAIESAADAGVTPTRSYVREYYNAHAGACGLQEVSEGTMTKWTQASYPVMPFELGKSRNVCRVRDLEGS